ncbi:MAG: DUF4870 domain-containing protein [Acidithiobacillus sp.]
MESPEQAISTSRPSSEDTNTATIVHLSGILLGIIVPLVLYLVKKDSASPWLRSQILEALNFQITLLIAYLISGILAMLLVGLVFFGLLFLVNIVFCILAAVQSSSGADYRYPIALRLLK